MPRMIPILACLVVAGCGPFQDAVKVPFMKPIEGRWSFDRKASLDANGIADTDNLAPLYEHEDLEFRGNMAVGDGRISSEYRFFALHQHGDLICGKAWHHEDRFDPGDMSKCHVRLQVKSGKLVLQVYSNDDGFITDDPDFKALEQAGSFDPFVTAPADQCDSPAIEGDAAAEWGTYVFVREGS